MLSCAVIPQVSIRRISAQHYGREPHADVHPWEERNYLSETFNSQLLSRVNCVSIVAPLNLQFMGFIGTHLREVQMISQINVLTLEVQEPQKKNPANVVTLNLCYINTVLRLLSMYCLISSLNLIFLAPIYMRTLTKLIVNLVSCWQRFSEKVCSDFRVTVNAWHICPSWSGFFGINCFHWMKLTDPTYDAFLSKLKAIYDTFFHQRKQ